MTTTIALDETLLARAQEITGKSETSDIVNEALKVYIQLDSARKLAAMGGTEPQLKRIPRRKIA